MKTISPKDAEVIIQKLPSDMGIHRNSRKGTLDAPDKILDNFELDETVLVDEVFPDEFDLEETQKRVEENTRDIIKHEKPLVSIGGDHSVSYPVVKALKEKYPDLQLVWLDSHLDLKEKVDDHVSHDVVIRELLEKDFSEDEIWIVGYTRVDKDEEKFLENSDLKTYSHEELDKFKREFGSSEQPVYLSVDIDVLKEELAPGTGYPDGKLGIEQAKKVIKKVSPNSADLVEVAPSLDENGRTLKSSIHILKKILEEVS